MNHFLLKRTLVLLAWMIWLTTDITWAAQPRGQPLGNEVVERQTAYAKKVVIPPFTLNGMTIIQDRSNLDYPGFKDLSSRMCPPFCVQPEEIPGISTIKVEDFVRLAPDINAGKMLILDMRNPEWYGGGTIPGAISLPYSDLTSIRNKTLAKMKKLAGKDLIGFCNGWWCGQSLAGLKVLLYMGYKGKLYYFRGGHQEWVEAGLPIVIPRLNPGECLDYNAF